jgi:hypothetical protein
MASTTFRPAPSRVMTLGAWNRLVIVLNHGAWALGGAGRGGAGRGGAPAHGSLLRGGRPDPGQRRLTRPAPTVRTAERETVIA